MSQKKTIILKLTGEVIQHAKDGLNATLLERIAEQIKKLTSLYTFGIVMGGGNFFRGAQEGAQMHITPQVGHTVGMLATMMNGLLIQDIFERTGINTCLLTAVQAETIGFALSPQNIRHALAKKDCLIFAGGTGSPFFTTDTTAVVRALQIDAHELWKGTKVDGVYTSDPAVDKDAKLLKKLTYDEAISKRLAIMDMTAYALAEQHNVTIRIFNIFAEHALTHVALDKNYGSTIET